MNDFLREVIQPQILKCGCASDGRRDTVPLNRAHSLFTEPQSREVGCGKSNFLGKQAAHSHHKTHPWMIIVHQKFQKQKKRDCNARWVTLPPREKREGSKVTSAQELRRRPVKCGETHTHRSESQLASPAFQNSVSNWDTELWDTGNVLVLEALVMTEAPEASPAVILLKSFLLCLALKFRWSFFFPQKNLF